jgi:carbon monoxide dehydrogenase subunit G
MASGSTETSIARDPEAVWKVVGDFGDLKSWLPGIDECTLEGDDRVLSMMGMTLRERLVKRDDAKHSITYSIVESPMQIDKHEATVTITAADGGSRVTWDVEVVPDNLLDIFVQTYAGGLESLKKNVES